MHIRVDNFSKHKQFSKGYINRRVEDIDKMRDFDNFRGLFAPNRFAFLRAKLAGFARAFFQTFGREKTALREMIGRKLRSFSIFDAIFLILFMVIAKLGQKLLRLFYIIEYSLFKESPNRTILPIQTDYIGFEGKDLLDLNIRDVWRPSVVTEPGEVISSVLEPGAGSEVRLSFSLLENADPQVMDGHWGVRINLKLTSSNNSEDRSFHVPIFHETDYIEEERDPLWLNFSLDVGRYVGQKVKLDVRANYEHASHNGGRKQLTKSPTFAFGAPRMVIKKEPSETKKILFISMESMTDPFFISETDQSENLGLFRFLKERDWVTFSRTYAQSDGTLGTASSYFTGLTPVQHGVFDYGDPYWSRYGCAWNRNLMSLAQLLKGKNFATISVGPKSFSGHTGCSRGFDSHFSFYSLHDPEYADREWFIQNWDMVSQEDAFLFVHFDRLHKPYVHFNRLRDRVYSIDEFDGSRSQLEVYMNQMGELDLELRRLLGFLHGNGQYDNTMIIITGDHGGAYNWKKRLAYDLYEDRVRVPLWIKMPDWRGDFLFKTDEPVNGSILPFQIILKELDIPLPAYFSELPQTKEEFVGVAISETETHPTYRDYVLSLTNRDFKYVRSMKVNWDKNSVLSVEREIMQPFPYAARDMDLTNDYSSEYPQDFKLLRELADVYIQSSFEFRSRYPLEKGRRKRGF